MLDRTAPRTAGRSRRRSARRALVGAVALAFAPLLLVSVAAAPAHACTCDTGSIGKQLKAADLVMVGTVERVVPPSELPSPSNDPSATSSASASPTGAAASPSPSGVGTGPDEETLQVVATRLFKGELETSRTRVVSVGGGSCAWYDPAVDTRLLFVVQGGRTSLCSGSQPVSDGVMAKVHKVLGSGRKMPAPPLAEAVRTKVEEAPPQGFNRLAAPGAAVALLGLLGLVVVRGVRRG